MKRLALNASPRGKKSNSRLLISWIHEGLRSVLPASEEAPQVMDLADILGQEAALRAFLDADEVLVVMPLYTDQSPGVFMRFIETLSEKIDADPAGLRESIKGKRVGFVLQSGFPESVHSEALRDWLLRLGERLGLDCLGVAIKGGVEGVRMRPENSMKKLKARFMALGAAMARGEAFPAETLERMASPRKLGFIARTVLRALKPTGLVDFYWNYMLKKHGAWERRFDAPYA